MKCHLFISTVWIFLRLLSNLRWIYIRCCSPSFQTDLLSWTLKFQKRGLKNLGWHSNYVQAVTAIKPLSVCITIHTGNTLLWSRKCPNIVWSASNRKGKKMKWLYHLLVQRQHSMSIITFLLWIKLSHLKKTQIVNFRLISLFL